jgi:hypothetical protein
MSVMNDLELLRLKIDNGKSPWLVALAVRVFIQYWHMVQCVVAWTS